MDDFQTQFNQAIQTYAQGNTYGVSLIPNHAHTGADSPLITTVNLPPGVPVDFGYGALNSADTSPGTAGEQIGVFLVSGKPTDAGPISSSSNNLQLNLLHQPNNSLNQSFITAFRNPNFSLPVGQTISVTGGGNTVTIPQVAFVTNYYANALIDIYDSTGTFVETQIIASNTATVITISGTWLNTTTNGSIFIYQPVYLGSADDVWQRVYTQEGTAGGIRFGVGATNGIGGTPPSQNGLLYSDATGDLYWRNKAGTSTKLN